MSLHNGIGNQLDFIRCPICCENFVSRDSVSFGPCGHVYHSSCIRKWLDKHNTCCYCREEIVKSRLRTKCDEETCENIEMGGEKEEGELYFCVVHGLLAKGDKEGVHKCKCYVEESA